MPQKCHLMRRFVLFHCNNKALLISIRVIIRSGYFRKSSPLLTAVDVRLIVCQLVAAVLLVVLDEDHLDPGTVIDPISVRTARCIRSPGDSRKSQVSRGILAANRRAEQNCVLFLAAFITREDKLIAWNPVEKRTKSGKGDLEPPGWVPERHGTAGIRCGRSFRRDGNPASPAGICLPCWSIDTWKIPRNYNSMHWHDGRGGRKMLELVITVENRGKRDYLTSRDRWGSIQCRVVLGDGLFRPRSPAYNSILLENEGLGWIEGVR